MDSSLISMVFQSALGLAAVLGLFALMVWGMRRVQLKTNMTQHDFKVTRRIHIDNRNSIIEICHRGKHYLLGVSAAGLTQLHAEHSLPAQADIAEAAGTISSGKS